MAFIGVAAIASISGRSGSGEGSGGGFWNSVGDFLGGFNEGFNPGREYPEPDLGPNLNGPSVSISHNGDPEVGEEIAIEVSVTEGDAPFSEGILEVTNNEGSTEIDITNKNELFDLPVTEGNNRYMAKVEDENGRTGKDIHVYNPSGGAGGTELEVEAHVSGPYGRDTIRANTEPKAYNLIWEVANPSGSIEVIELEINYNGEVHSDKASSAIDEETLSNLIGGIRTFSAGYNVDFEVRARDSDGNEVDDGGFITVEPNGSGESTKYEGTKWEIFLQVIGESNIRDDVKKIIIEILEGNPNKYHAISFLWPFTLWRIVESVQREKVPEAAREVVSYTVQNEISNISADYFNAVKNILDRNYSLQEGPLKAKNNPHTQEQNQNEPILQNTFKKTYHYLKEVLEESKKIVQLDEQAIEDFHEGMEIFEEHRDLISAFANINQDKLEQALNEPGSWNKAKKIVTEAEQRAGIEGANLDPQTIKEIEQSIKMIENNIGEAAEVLKKANNLVKKEYKEDVDIEKSIQKFEASYIHQLKGAMKGFEMAYKKEIEEGESVEGKWEAE